MAITFTWSVEMEVAKDLDGKVDAVTSVHWRCTAVDSEFTATAYGQVMLDAPGDPYVAFQDLTRDQVIEWAKAKIFTGEAEAPTEDGMKAALTEQIENQRSPKVVNKVPDSWVA